VERITVDPDEAQVGCILNWVDEKREYFFKKKKKKKKKKKGKEVIAAHVPELGCFPRNR
jgi:hypothetical protein